MKNEKSNAYLTMPLAQVEADAKHGVRLARIAWRQRDKDGAGRVLGFVVEPSEQRDEVIMELKNE